MNLIMVERAFETAPVVSEMQSKEAVVSWCFETNSVVPMHSYCSRDGKRMLCLYTAPDAEAVRKTQIEAGLPFTAIYEVEPLYPNGDGSGS